MERNKKRKYHFCKSIVSKQKDGSHRLFVLVGVTGNILLRNLHCLTTQALRASVPVCAPPACKQSTGLLCRDGRRLLKVRTLLINSKQKDGSHRLFVLVGVTGNILLRNLHCLTTQALRASVPVCAPPACKQSTGLLCRDGRRLLKVRTLLINSKQKDGSHRLFVLVGVTGFEPAASTSQMSHATNCATPRKY